VLGLKTRSKAIVCSLVAVFLAAMPNAGLSANAEKSAGIGKEDMIYSLMTDRFYNGDSSNDANTAPADLKSYHGGDFQGILDKLDYIKDLGFTAVWISPVVDNESFGYHGYWAADFYKTEEHFGTKERLKELVDAAHSKGLKIIVDLVVNHTGAQNPWVGDPAHAGWFHDAGSITDWNNQTEIENGRLSGLPDLNTENPEVRKYLVDMAKWWIRETGFDGYRLDTVRHVPKSFWEEFVREIKKEYPSFYFLGEVFSGDAGYVAGYQQTGIDGITDFPMYYAINDVLGGANPATQLAEAIETGSVYKDRSLMATFIDNHDVPRFTNRLTALKTEKLEQALAFLMTYTGIPVLYYGTEIAMKGGSDPDNRRDMDWTAASPVRDYVKQLTAIRKSNPALTQGDIKIVKAEKDFLCYSRSTESNTVLVALNTSNKEKTATLPVASVFSNRSGKIVSLLDGKELAPVGGELAITMTPRQAILLTVKASGIRLGILPLPIGLLLVIALVLFVVIRTRRKG
jgi:alpha-amylase